MLLRMLEVVECRLCLMEAMKVLEAMRCAALYTGGCGGWAQFRGFEIALWQCSRYSPPPLIVVHEKRC